MVLKQTPIIILDRKSAICMAKNGNDTKHTRHIFIIMQFVRNYEDYNFHNTVWHKGGLQLADIRTNNFREDEYNPILGYAMVGLEN